MTKNKAVRVIEVRLDTQGVQNNMAALNKTLETLSDNLETVSQWDMSGFVADLQDVKETLDEISILLGQKIDSGSWITAFSEITSSVDSLLGIGLALAEVNGIPELLVELGNAISGANGTAGTAGGVLGGLSAGTILGIAAAVVLATTVIVQNLDLIKAKFTEMWENHIKPLWDNISASIISIGDSLMSIWNGLLQPIIDWIISVFEPAILTVIYAIIGVIEVVFSLISDVIGGLFVALDGVIQFIAGVFTGDWEKAWDGVCKVFKGLFEAIGGVVKVVFNAIIWAINVFIGLLYSVIAGVLNAVGGIVSVVGNMVGEDWSFSVPTNPPQIPYLAKGAVLPANKPFLAMVGDQKHGTNVEAPLATIQEAVAVVMEDMIPAMMAGFEAVVNEQRATRQAVESIELGDTVIGQAAARYSRKMAVIKGG